MKTLHFRIFCLIVLLLPGRLIAQFSTGSGGELLPGQAAYDVDHYKLDLRIDPADSTVAGFVRIGAKLTDAVDSLIVDLHPGLSVDRILFTGTGNPPAASYPAGYRRDMDSKRIRIARPGRVQPGERFEMELHYHGKPPVAANPPWDGGMVWSATAAGDPWIGVASQSDGAWIWWPNKDHPSDKPDSVTIRFTLPDDLIVVSNGVLRESLETEPGWRRWEWFVPTPISPYNVTLNAAPYRELRRQWRSVSGEQVEAGFWVLPERKSEAKRLMKQAERQFTFLEELLGPYPFRNQKFGIAHAPYLGMEHQTVIAYGADFRNDNLFGAGAGFDDLLQHELAHEWWGNLVSAADWSDFWLHEGFATYMQALYAWELGGDVAYRRMMARFRQWIRGVGTLAPRRAMTSREIVEEVAGSDLYYRGAWVLHTLRYHIGDELFFRALRRFLYPDPEQEREGVPPPVRLVTTDDFLALLNRLGGEDLGWFFESYLRSPALPKLRVERTADRLEMSWHRVGPGFAIAVEVDRNGERQRLIPEEGRMVLEIPSDADIVVDPDSRILMELDYRHANSRPEK